MRWPFHHRHRAKKNIAAVPQTIQGIQLSSSAVGSAIPLVYGQARVSSRLIHYKKLTLLTGNLNGLPPGSDDPNNSAIAMALCEGPIAGVLKAFDDRDETDSQTDVFQSSTDFTAGSTTSLTLRHTPIAGSVTLQFPRNGLLTISTVVGSVVTFTGAIPLGTSAVVLYYQVSGTLSARGFVTFLGTLSQAAWSFLTTNYPGPPTEAVPYELTAYMANPSWPTPNGSLPNYSWEVQALLQWGSGIIDSNPKDIVTDFLTDPNHGAGFPSSLIASLVAFRDYCTASGSFFSPVYDTQAPAAQHLQELVAAANSALVWSDGQLKIIPYADTAITGNGVTYTPNVTPLYNLTDDDFIAEDADPVRVTRRAQADVYNQIRVEFDNRSYKYNGDIAEAKDQASIEQYGLKPAPVIKAPFIKDPAVGRLVAQLALQRQVYIRNTFQFSLGYKYGLLEPMDLVTLTDANLGLNQTTVRLTEVVEEEDGTFSCTAEEWPFGVATAALYGTASSSGAPTATQTAVPAFPGITVSFDTTGQAILNLTGDARTVKHIYVLRTDRLPTAAETRAGTTVNLGSQSSIATGAIVAVGAPVYVGDLAYNSGGGESPLSTSTVPREMGATSTPPTPLNINLFTYNSGGATSGQMWLAWSWSAFLIYMPDGTTISVPGSSSLPTPPTPTLSQVVSGALAGRTRFVRIGYTKNGMIYRVGAEASLAISANNLLRVTSPAAVAGYDGWVPLVGSTTNTEFTQSSALPSAPVAFGTNWTEPTTGADISGQTPFDVTNWPNAVIAWGLNASSTFWHYPWWEIAAGIVAFGARGQTAKSAALAQAQLLDGHIPLSIGAISGVTSTAGTPATGSPIGGKFL